MEIKELEVRDWILLGSALIVVIGWFVDGLLNRRHEIAKLRAEHRIDTLKNFISFFVEANEKKSLDKFNDIQVQFYLYGYKDEVALIKHVTDIVTTDPNNPEWLSTLKQLNILVRNRLRKELRLPKVKS
ncbi:hypothetical protein [Oceanospirillum maris]|uniref:hypothetical protein n=1 Tax=Oceanospirillum maris TaxID=64977 RepID=UPI00041310F2|nr:hypothetical protein [Oceanospirillum maris]